MNVGKLSSVCEGIVNQQEISNIGMVFDLPRLFADVRRNQITEDAISNSDIPE